MIWTTILEKAVIFIWLDERDAWMQHNSLSPSDIMYSKYFEAPKLLEISYPSKIDVHSLIQFS